MKNIILTVSLIAVMFGILGCGSIGPKITTASGEAYYMTKQSGGDYAFSAPATDLTDVQKEGEKVHNASVKRKTLKFQLTAAAKYTKKLGYKYFVVTNVNISNLNGFPINNYRELSRYITLAERKARFATNGTARDSNALIGNGTYPDMRLRFMPVSNAVANSGAISVWKVSEFLR